MSNNKWSDAYTNMQRAAELRAEKKRQAEEARRQREEEQRRQAEERRRQEERKRQEEAEKRKQQETQRQAQEEKQRQEAQKFAQGNAGTQTYAEAVYGNKWRDPVVNTQLEKKKAAAESWTLTG
ncbi:MAG: hypothetical protein VB081_12770 [Christensenella sp.]|uniref:hypothetical protein n=1 Tax=Christensenella sp. TaxID=1935934 RepID=UPI002B1F71F6|nr:hypothetical protein [Christensenella sp.]MEA5004351.1 hypothetical protein [Christensenella sp.]